MEQEVLTDNMVGQALASQEVKIERCEIPCPGRVHTMCSSWMDSLAAGKEGLPTPKACKEIKPIWFT